MNTNRISYLLGAVVFFFVAIAIISTGSATSEAPHVGEELLLACDKGQESGVAPVFASKAQETWAPTVFVNRLFRTTFEQVSSPHCPLDPGSLVAQTTHTLV